VVSYERGTPKGRAVSYERGDPVGWAVSYERGTPVGWAVSDERGTPVGGAAAGLTPEGPGGQVLADLPVLRRRARSCSGYEPLFGVYKRPVFMRL